MYGLQGSHKNSWETSFLEVEKPKKDLAGLAAFQSANRLSETLWG